MLFKITIPLLILFISINSFALLHIPSGKHKLQGKILIINNETYFSINHNTNSETRFKLKGKLPKGFESQNGTNAVITLKTKKPVFSFTSEAEFISLDKYFEPFEKIKVYRNESELK